MKIAYVVGNEDLNDPDPDLDIPFAIKAAEQLEIDLVFANWNDKSVVWESFDAAVIRSAWDYVPVRDEFLQFAKDVETKTKLFNSYEVMRWNTDKKHLSILENKGVPIIPTKFASNIDEAAPAISWAFEKGEAIAIKPTVGAGARLAGRATNEDDAIEYVKRIFKANRTAIIQPYVSSVDDEGEKAIIVINGEISHVAKKVPALTKGGHGDAAGQLEITSEIRDIVKTISNAVNEWNDLLFARVDVVRMGEKLVLMELELTEPWLFMQFRPEAGVNLFKALKQRIA
jgi:glutathione synthase/RimK-type ligase-like ATP-grasp enzyme